MISLFSSKVPSRHTTGISPMAAGTTGVALLPDGVMSDRAKVSQAVKRSSDAELRKGEI